MIRANYYEPYENPFDPAIEEDIRRPLGRVKGPLVDKLLEKLTLFNATGPIQSLSGMGRLVNVSPYLYDSSVGTLRYTIF